MKNTVKSIISLTLSVMLIAASVILTGFTGILSAKADSVKVTVAGNSKGDIIEFGSYPQSIVTDSDLKAALNEAAGSTDSWTSFNYFSGTGEFDDGEMTASDYMVYTDIELDGAKYRGVFFTEYRPFYTGGIGADSNIQEYHGYNAGEIYWFAFEPLQWRVLNPVTGLVIAEKAIDSQAYNNFALCAGDEGSGEWYGDAECENFAIDYENSSIRAWLNNDFANTAFTADELANIEDTTVTNSALLCNVVTGEETEYTGADTTDKIYLLSIEDVLSVEYFADDCDRQTTGTDYALCNGMASTDCYAFYWTRSAIDSLGMNAVTECGDLDINDAINTDVAVRPVFNFVSCEHANTAIRGAAAAECAREGYTGDEYCTVCGKILAKGSVIAALGHSYTSVDAKAPTCYKNGWNAYEVCTRCGDNNKVTVKATGHSIINHEAKAATCTEIGWKAYETCANCDYSTYEEIPATGHEYVNHAAKAATCTEGGYEAYKTCANCDYVSFIQTTDALGHDIINHAAKEATATENGWNAYETCSRCAYSTYEEIEALGVDELVVEDAEDVANNQAANTEEAPAENNTSTGNSFIDFIKNLLNKIFGIFGIEF